MSVIAIDGPAGAGKSTVAKRVAERLGWHHLDTGAMYRSLALAVLQAGGDPEEPADVARVATKLDATLQGGRVLLEGVDVTERIRDQDVTLAVAQVAVHPAARLGLVKLQRRAAENLDVVMEGRDIGTAVFPDAELKIYLTASLAERARRRWSETDAPQETRVQIQREIERRDVADSTRETSPLRRAPDAVEIDSSERSIDEVVEIVVDAARAKDLVGKGQ
ncbi:MAG: (d)CMP kinase [Actinomycetota bacterium]